MSPLIILKRRRVAEVNHTPRNIVVVRSNIVRAKQDSLKVLVYWPYLILT